MDVSKADFATVRALNFRQSDRFSHPEDFKDSPVLFSSELKGFFEKKKIKSTQQSEGF